MTTPEDNGVAATTGEAQTNAGGAEVEKKKVDASDEPPAEDTPSEDVAAKLDPSNAKKVAAKDPKKDPPDETPDKKPKKRTPRKSNADPKPKDPPKETAKRATTAKLTITSEPSGALVLVNGRTQTTKTPLDVEVKKGARIKLELRYKGYKNLRRTLSVNKDHSVTYKLKPGVVF